MQIVLLLSVFLLQGSYQQAAQPRRILLFGRKAEPLIQQQWKLLQKDSIGLAKRDIEITIVKPGEPLYKTYHVSALQRFTIILVGKDGGEKFRSNQLTSVTRLFALIDAMPMRRAEMQKQKNDQK